MPRQRTTIEPVVGINKDLSPFELPPERWSDGFNINFRRGRTNSSKGFSQPYAIDDTIVRTDYAIDFRDGNTYGWVYAGRQGNGNGSIAKTDGSTVTILKEFLQWDVNADWSGCDFNSAIIYVNKLNPPQFIASPYEDCIELPNWSDANDTWRNGRCEVIRPYKNYLVAMDCYDNTGRRYANMVRWSSPALLGEPPSSWDDEDPGEQAGSYPLADTPGDVVDGLTLGDYFVIYKQDSVWLMQFTGGPATMSFRKLFGDEAGIMSKDCVADFEGKHFVLSSNGAYVHNTTTKQEVMDNWVKDEYFNNVNRRYQEDTKVVADHSNGEIWVYYVSNESRSGVLGQRPYADRALVWDWETGEWSQRELDQYSFIGEGWVVPTNDPENTEGFKSLMFAQHYKQLFWANEYLDGADPRDLISQVTRIGIDLGDDRVFKYVTRVTPHIRGTSPVNIGLFATDTQEIPTQLADFAVFDPTTDVDIDVHVNGRYIGIIFESQDEFEINAYTLEWEPAGKF